MDWQRLAWPGRWLKLKRFCRRNRASAVFAHARVKAKGRDNELIARGLSSKAAAHCIFRFTGNGNVVELEDLEIPGILKVVISGSNNRVVLRGGTRIVTKLQIDMWQEGERARVEVGRDCSLWEVTVRNTDSDSSVTIGDDCIFSKQVVISNTDEHAILADGQVINRAGALTVGTHAWIGQGASLMKSCAVPDGCIVARNAVVTHRFTETDSVLAGMPAKVVKRGVHWVRDTVNSLTGPADK